jgi:hypothetical protein
MKRFLLVTLTVLSSLLCAGLGVLWYRSPDLCDYASTVTRGRHYVAATFPGGVKFSTWEDPLEPPAPFKYTTYQYGVKNAEGAWMDRPAVSWSKWGFDYRPLQFSYQVSASQGAFEVLVPFWFLVGLTALPLLSTWMNSMIRRARCAHWKCACGFDMRLVPMGVEACPQCGARDF